MQASPPLNRHAGWGLNQGHSTVDLHTYRRSISELKQNAILTSARAIFLERGYSRSGMSDIARQADVSTATLYKHFPSKENLFQAVVDENYSESNTSGIEEPLETSPEGSARQILKKALERCLNHQSSASHTALQRLVIAEVQAAPHLAGKIYANDDRLRVDLLKSALDSLVKVQSLTPHDTELSSRLLLGMVRELAAWPQLFGLRAAIEPTQTEEILSLFLARYSVADAPVDTSAPGSA